MTKTCIAIRHVHFEGLGTFTQPICEAGYQIQYLDPTRDDLEPAKDAALTVFLGGPIGVYGDADYPFLKQEIDIAARRLKKKQPMLGICLGAQIIARACGAKVYAGNHGKEIGWKAIALTDAGKKSVIAPLGEQGAQMFHWHGDTFDLPPNATLLASTDSYPNQIFSIEDHVLAFQCHPELNPVDIEQWLVGHAFEIAKTQGINAFNIRKETGTFGGILLQKAQQSIKSWLIQHNFL